MMCFPEKISSLASNPTSYSTNTCSAYEIIQNAVETLVFGLIKLPHINCLRLASSSSRLQMRKSLAHPLSVLILSFTDAVQGPNDGCWPSRSQWGHFNDSIGGKLIADVPPAIVCYPGPEFDAQACAEVDVALTNQSFVADNPIALSYPTDSCPSVNLKANPCAIGYSNSAPCSTTNASTPVGTCSIGDQPRYTVNATEARDVAAAVDFAKSHNIRLVVRNTGHDILRR